MTAATLAFNPLLRGCRNHYENTVTKWVEVHDKTTFQVQGRLVPLSYAMMRLVFDTPVTPRHTPTFSSSLRCLPGFTAFRTAVLQRLRCR
jgi:hypothetical protein